MSSALIRSTIQACILAGVSNLTAQLISAYKNGVSNLIEKNGGGTNTEQSPYAVDWTPIIQFMFFNLLNCPPNFLWYVDLLLSLIYAKSPHRQQYIETAFPSTYTTPAPSAIAAAATKDGKELDREEKKHEILETKLSVPNAIIKFLLDQTIGAAVNTIMFSVAIAGFRGATYQQAVRAAQQDLWPLMTAGWKVWPAISALNFTVVRSVEMRQLLGSLAGFGWNIYLSLSTA
jgi:protein Mpv17